MKDSVSPDIFVTEPRGLGIDIVVKGDTPGMRDWFFEAVKRTVVTWNTSGIETARYDTSIEPQPDGSVTFRGTRVRLNEHAFRVDENDFSDLREMVICHEAAEMWYQGKPGISVNNVLSKGRKSMAFAHFLAMIEEYRLGLVLGKAERFHEFYKLKTQDSELRKISDVALETARSNSLDQDLMRNHDRLYNLFWRIYRQ